MSDECRHGDAIREAGTPRRPVGDVVVEVREVSCLYGFTRFEAAPTSADGEIEDVRLAVHGAPLSLGADWLPAVEQFGEGLFIHFDEAAVAEWLAREPVRSRAAQLLAGFLLWRRAHGSTLDDRGRLKPRLYAGLSGRECSSSARCAVG